MAQITIDTLKSFLWAAAENLRGQIDAAGYKEYIFPLLFFKRISDVYDEQYAAFVAEGGEEYAEMQALDLPIRIPDGEHWQDVRQVTENVGQRLVEAFIAIEQANPARENDGRLIGGLEGIFGPKDGWTNKNKMPDHIITSIIEDFSRYNLSLSSCPADEMGQAYEYLVGKFADDAGNTAQEFYTNRTVVELMAEILQPQPDESIYDPTCGSGGMLIKSLDHLRNQGKEWKGVHVFGQEVNGLTSAIARMNLYLNGVEDFSIVCGDTLRNPAFLDGSHLRTFDIVLANPPYSIKEWDRAAFENDKWGRNFLGTPPQGRADYAFIQHILASMDEKNGRCAILLPHGVLFRKEEQEIRKKMIEADLLEAVIGIGPNLFFNATMEACIYICRSNKPVDRRNKIMFINAVKEVTRRNGESFLEEQHIQKIVDAYNGYVDVENFCSVVDKEAVAAYEYDLSVQKFAFIPTEQNQMLISTDVAYSAWSEQSVRLNNIVDTFINML
ncbi:MAG: class I SAM-dependent DNA methyltransferase [Paludibacteraceae bacterium]|nr:class I SAM-dependent DNA methyltransferase [Paludibacteraceae bacterium]